MPKNVMIVDDANTVRHVVSLALRKEGYNIIEACDGKDALSKLSGEKIHLIISDVNMPNMDGITFVKQLKANPSYKFTPVIMLTTESEQSKIAEAKAAGAKAWICKPFEPQEMLAAVKQLMLP